MSELQNLTVSEYLLEYDDEMNFDIVLKRRPGLEGIVRWSINRGNATLSKTKHKGYYHFVYERHPSTRLDEYYRKYRWNTAEEACQFWFKNRPEIIALSIEKRRFAEHNRWKIHRA